LTNEGPLQKHLVIYLRLLDADAEGADWQEVAKSSRTSTQNTNRLDQSVRRRDGVTGLAPVVKAAKGSRPSD
jgi:hypothetical protein